LLEQSRQLINRLRQLSREELGNLMKISEKLSKLNWQRYREFHMPFSLDNAMQAIIAFQGDVYNGIDIKHYNDKDLQFAQQHLRILSGLYGVLKPLDLIQPYRLEMGTKLSTSNNKNLYEFWDNQITDLLNERLESDPSPVLINLASNEYYKVVQPKKLQATVLTICFKDLKNGTYKTIAIYAKRARGLMVDFIIKNKIKKPDDIKKFTAAGYNFNQSLSNDSEWVFCREQNGK
jgi:uncharacterized protein